MTISQKDLTSRKRGPIQKVGTTVTLKEARTKGFTLYWDGINCPNGHESVRYSNNGACKQCYYNKLKLGSLEVIFYDKEPAVEPIIITDDDINDMSRGYSG